MYVLGEDLEYPALMETAHAKMVSSLLTKRKYSPLTMKDIVDCTYSPLELRRFMDQDGSLKELTVAAVITHEYKHWSRADTADFAQSIEDYPEFLKDWVEAKEIHKDLITLSTGAKERAKERMRFGNGGG